MSKWLLKIKRHFALFIAVLLVVSCLAEGVVSADMVNVGEPKITVTVGDTVIDENGEFEYNEGDSVSVTFEWNDVPDGEMPDPIIYEVGDDFIFDEISDTNIYQNSEVVGYWKVEDGKLYIYFDDDYRINKEGRSFLLRASGEFDLTDPGNTGTKHRFKIGEHEYDLNVKYNDTKIGLSKTMSSVRYDGERFHTDVTITATIDGYADNIVFEDIMGSRQYSYARIHYREGTMRVVDQNGNDVPYHLELKPPKGENKTENAGFYLYIDKALQDEKLTITYTANVDDRLMERWSKENTDQLDSYMNYITGKYDDANGELKDMPTANANTLNRITKPSLSKNGTITKDADGNDCVVWTVTFRTYSYGDLSDEELLKRLNLDIIEFLDELTGGVWFEGDDRTDQNRTFTLEDFDKQYNASDESWTYVLTVTTPASGSGNYKNHIETDVGGLRGKNSNLVGEKSFGDTIFKPSLDKSFRREIKETNTMEWQFVVDIPYSDQRAGQNTYSLIEEPTPEDKSKNKVDYTHRYVEGSAKFYAADMITGPDGKQVVDESSMIPFDPADYKGFTLTGNGTVSFQIDISLGGDFTVEFGGKKLVVILETEAVLVNGENVGSLEGTFDWENEVRFQYGHFGQNTLGTTSTYDRDDYAKNDDTDITFTKSAVSEEEGIFTWRVYVNTGSDAVESNPSTHPVWKKHYSNTKSFYFQANTIELTDYLPEGHIYVPGSATVRLRNIWNAMDKILTDDDIPGYESLLNEGLSESYDAENGTVKFKWQSNGTMRSTFASCVWNESAFKPDSWGFVYDYAEGGIVFEFQTMIDRDSDILKDKKGTIYFTNNVEGTADDVELGHAFAVKDYYVEPTLTKGGIYNDPDSITPDGIYNARYSIEINPERIKYLDGEGHLELQDTMGRDLDLIFSSFVLLKHDPDDDSVTYTLNREDYYFNYDQNSHQITLRIEDGVHYTLKYDATFTDPGVGNALDAKNTVVLYGNGQIGSAETPSLTEIPKSSGVAYSKVYLTIQKFASDTHGVFGLPGAEFELVEVDYDIESGEFSVSEGATARTYISDGTGKIPLEFDSADAATKIYRLTETKAPEGYKKLEGPIYFVFSDYSDQDNLPETVLVYSHNDTAYIRNDPGSDNPGQLFPSSGSNGLAVLCVSAAALAVLGLALLPKRKKQEE